MNYSDFFKMIPEASLVAMTLQRQRLKSASGSIRWLRCSFW